MADNGNDWLAQRQGKAEAVTWSSPNNTTNHHYHHHYHHHGYLYLYSYRRYAIMQSALAFRLLYNFVFTVLTVLLVALLVITPADAIKQALHNNQLYNVFVVAGCYLLTFILASLIYASRIYTNRSIIASIPKTFIPVEKEDVGKRVRKMIVESLNRSALSAWEARPRINNQNPVAAGEPEVATSAHENTEDRPGRRMTRHTSNAIPALSINIQPHPPVWGEISHRGWSSPLSADLPNLQYITVIQELPNLIEAKAVSLAPTDPTTNPPMPDLRAVDLLQRPATLGLREYTTRLINLRSIADPSLANSFITAYERARFSTQPISEHEFRELMKMFADLLRNMTPLDPGIFDNDDNYSDPMLNESDIDDDASSKSTPITPRSRSIAPRSGSGGVPSRSGSEGTICTAMSRRPGTNHSQSQEKANRNSTSLSIPRSRAGAGLEMTRMSSLGSVHKTSRSSLRSLGSGGGGSVIRLNLNPEQGELPYIVGS